MRWFRATPVLALAPVAISFALAATPFFACSNGDTTTSTGTIAPPSQPGQTKVDAGATCGSSDDCEPGLVCLFPASASSSCNTLAVCVVQPACTQSVPMCSCLAEPIQVCGGYAENPVDPTSSCDAGVVIPPVDGGGDATAPDDGSVDSAPGIDATDAADSGD